MSILIYVLLALIGLLALFAIALLVAELRVVNHLAEVNKQLLIVVAGKDEKPESALRALVALNKPPQGKLKGIADGKKKKDEKPANINYTMGVGITDGL